MRRFAGSAAPKPIAASAVTDTPLFEVYQATFSIFSPGRLVLKPATKQRLSLDGRRVESTLLSGESDSALDVEPVPTAS